MSSGPMIIVLFVSRVSAIIGNVSRSGNSPIKSVDVIGMHTLRNAKRAYVCGCAERALSESRRSLVGPPSQEHCHPKSHQMMTTTALRSCLSKRISIYAA